MMRSRGTVGGPCSFKELGLEEEEVDRGQLLGVAGSIDVVMERRRNVTGRKWWSDRGIRQATRPTLGTDGTI